jgi:hypothetical protein
MIIAADKWNDYKATLLQQGFVEYGSELTKQGSGYSIKLVVFQNAKQDRITHYYADVPQLGQVVANLETSNKPVEEFEAVVSTIIQTINKN